MIDDVPSSARWQPANVLAALARFLLGGIFIYMGLSKALHPIEFLKMVRQYDALHSPLLLNLVASALPWFETFCGLLLVLGLVVRGTAVMLLGMLIPFSILVLLRALAMHDASGLPFCAINFDCGCGTGEVLICRKLAENLLVIVFSAGLLVWRKRCFKK